MKVGAFSSVDSESFFTEQRPVTQATAPVAAAAVRLLHFWSPALASVTSPLVFSREYCLHLRPSLFHSPPHVVSMFTLSLQGGL